MSEFKEWRLASGYTYDKRQEQAWNAATRAEREQCARVAEELHCEEPPETYKDTMPWSLGLTEEWEVYQCYHGDRIATATRNRGGR